MQFNKNLLGILFVHSSVLSKNSKTIIFRKINLNLLCSINPKSFFCSVTNRPGLEAMNLWLHLSTMPGSEQPQDEISASHHTHWNHEEYIMWPIWFRVLCYKHHNKNILGRYTTIHTDLWNSKGVKIICQKLWKPENINIQMWNHMVIV